ncbi:hypothetical protein H2200_004249 [Cladophialophora chaetospira]|uniref:Uncharacterized protein n=1 Tax=Cladophialophora chaetospira TaxID=386627 RepID=A0AA38XCR9_9EURO|nr:hypothetical protein H2200_004249 [Cladophialophora chaetospira]
MAQSDKQASTSRRPRRHPFRVIESVNDNIEFSDSEEAPSFKSSVNRQQRRPPPLPQLHLTTIQPSLPEDEHSAGNLFEHQPSHEPVSKRKPSADLLAEHAEHPTKLAPSLDELEAFVNVISPSLSLPSQNQDDPLWLKQTGLPRSRQRVTYGRISVSRRSPLKQLSANLHRHNQGTVEPYESVASSEEEDVTLVDHTPQDHQTTTSTTQPDSIGEEETTVFVSPQPHEFDVKLAGTLRPPPQPHVDDEEDQSPIAFRRRPRRVANTPGSPAHSDLEEHLPIASRLRPRPNPKFSVTVQTLAQSDWSDEEDEPSAVVHRRTRSTVSTSVTAKTRAALSRSASSATPVLQDPSTGRKTSRKRRRDDILESKDDCQESEFELDDHSHEPDADAVSFAQGDDECFLSEDEDELAANEDNTSTIDTAVEESESETLKVPPLPLDEDEVRSRSNPECWAVIRVYCDALRSLSMDDWQTVCAKQDGKITRAFHAWFRRWPSVDSAVKVIIAHIPREVQDILVDRDPPSVKLAKLAKFKRISDKNKKRGVYMGLLFDKRRRLVGGYTGSSLRCLFQRCCLRDENGKAHPGSHQNAWTQRSMPLYRWLLDRPKSACELVPLGQFPAKGALPLLNSGYEARIPEFPKVASFPGFGCGLRRLLASD